VVASLANDHDLSGHTVRACVAEDQRGLTSDVLRARTWHRLPVQLAWLSELAGQFCGLPAAASEDRVGTDSRDEAHPAWPLRQGGFKPVSVPTVTHENGGDLVAH